MRLDSMRALQTLPRSINAWMVSSQPPECNTCRRPSNTRRRKLERYRDPLVAGTVHRLTRVDDGHQLRRRVQVCCQHLPPDGKVQLRRLDRARRIHERLHREQGPSHERLQLLEGSRGSARPQSRDGVERERHSRQRSLPWQHRDAGKSCGIPSLLTKLTGFHRWSRKTSKTSRI
jgi:hypothetical protein